MKDYKISYGDVYITYSKDEIKKAAAEGLTLIDNTTMQTVNLAANYNGWVTVVTSNGIIYSSWAGNFTVA